MTKAASIVQRALVVMAIVLLAGRLPVLADGDDSKKDTRWHVDVTPYIWAPSINGTAQWDRGSIRNGSLLPGRLPGEPLQPVIPAQPVLPTSGTLPVSLGPSSYLAHLNSAAMLTISAHNGSALLFTDIIYLNFSTNRTSIQTFTGPRSDVTVQTSSGASVRLTGAVWTVGGGYTLFRSGATNVDGFGGFRWVYPTATLDWTFAGPIGILNTSGHAQRGEWIADTIVGLRGKVGLGKHLYFPYYADIGTGAFSSTWQGVGGIGYGNFALLFRYLQYNMSGQHLFPSLRLGGLTLAGTFRM
jgi:hypothetical protein